jgi:hypothetical protein
MFLQALPLKEIAGLPKNLNVACAEQETDHLCRESFLERMFKNCANARNILEHVAERVYDPDSAKKDVQTCERCSAKEIRENILGIYLWV